MNIHDNITEATESVSEPNSKSDFRTFPNEHEYRPKTGIRSR